MSQITCPHCAFVNFAISAYCGRCERPLRGEATVTTLSPPPTPPPAPIRQPPPPAPSSRANAVPPSARPTAPISAASLAAAAAAGDRPLRAAAPPSPPPVSRSPLMQRLTPRQEPARDGPTSFGATLEPAALEPVPVTTATTLASAAALAGAATLDAGSRSTEVNVHEAPTVVAPAPVDPRPGRMETEDTVIPAQAASLWLLLPAMVVDSLAVLAVGLGLVCIEMLLFDGHWPSDRANTTEALGVWLHLYAKTAMRAATVAGLFAAGYSAWGARHGRTLGRAALGLEILRPNGAALGWTRAVSRALVSLVSVLSFGAGYFWMIVDNNHRSWPDLLADAVVVARRR